MAPTTDDISIQRERVDAAFLEIWYFAQVSEQPQDRDSAPTVYNLQQSRTLARARQIGEQAESILGRIESSSGSLLRWWT